jgi:hypothetical protein
MSAVRACGNCAGCGARSGRSPRPSVRARRRPCAPWWPMPPRPAPSTARASRMPVVDPASVRTLDDLARLPIVTKDDIRQRGDDLISSRHRKQDLRRAKTGGSTGVSLEIYCDEPGVQLRTAAALRSDEWSGWRLGQPMAAVWGNPPVPATWKARLRATLKERIIYLDTMRIDRPALERFVAEWERLRPGLLFGHAHSLFILAEYLQEQGRRLDPKGVVATSMMLLETRAAGDRGGVRRPRHQSLRLRGGEPDRLRVRTAPRPAPERRPRHHRVPARRRLALRARRGRPPGGDRAHQFRHAADPLRTGRSRRARATGSAPAGAACR